MRQIILFTWLITLVLANQIPWTLPVYVYNVSERLVETAVRKQTYLYGASKLGNTSFFPSGPGGQQLVLQSLIAFEEENAAISNRTEEDMADVMKAVNTVSHLQPRRTQLMFRMLLSKA